MRATAVPKGEPSCQQRRCPLDDSSDENVFSGAIEGTGKERLQQRCRDIGMSLDALVEGKKEKKEKVVFMVATKSIRGRYESLFDEVIRENFLFAGRLEETRA